MYPSIPKRIKATVFDSVVILTSVVLTMTAYCYIGIETPYIGVLIFIIVFLYEPILVSWKGRTFGHRVLHFRVIDVETTENISFLKAVGRYLIKLFLGVVSMLWAFFTDRQQSLHDIATNSVVISSDVPVETIKTDGLPEIPFSSGHDGIVQVSVMRRVTIGLLWFIVLFIIVSIVYGVAVPPECLEDNSGGISYCRQSENLLSYLYIGALFVCLGLGAKGMLFGARYKKQTISEIPD